MAQKTRAKKVAMSDQDDRLSALPDGILQHVLGFLPAQEVVRTSVLAPRWRHLWKSVRRLHITNPCPGEDSDEECGDDLCDFVNPLLLLRGHVTLDEVKFEYSSEFREQTNIWIRHALMCQAKVLKVVGVTFGDSLIRLGDPPLISRNLRKLELTFVLLEGKFLDFASCPELEILKMTDCEITTERILSKSLKLLCIESCFINSDHDRTCISSPSLIWLQLTNFQGRAPLLESMPSLQTASVKPDLMKWNSCEKSDSKDCCGVCSDCCGDDDYKGSCLLLGGLASAVNLELIAYPRMFLFRRDMNWCPTFSKLKKLLLDDWCVAVDLSALVYILKHWPVLENLTLHLHAGHKFSAQMEGSDTLMEKPTLSEHLKIMKIKCEDVDDRVYRVLKFLSTLDIEVTIKRTKRNSLRKTKAFNLLPISLNKSIV